MRGRRLAPGGNEPGQARWVCAFQQQSLGGIAGPAIGRGQQTNELIDRLPGKVGRANSGGTGAGPHAIDPAPLRAVVKFDALFELFRDEGGVLDPMPVKIDDIEGAVGPAREVYW